MIYTSQKVFKPEDFDKHKDGLVDTVDAARLANEILNKLIESSSVVYCNKNVAEIGNVWTDHTQKMDTHRAHLVFIEEIKREPCSHEPENLKFITNRNGMISILDVQKTLYNPIKKCKHCGVELRSTWSEKK